MSDKRSLSINEWKRISLEALRRNLEKPNVNGFVRPVDFHRWEGEGGQQVQEAPDASRLGLVVQEKPTPPSYPMALDAWPNEDELR